MVSHSGRFATPLQSALKRHSHYNWQRAKTMCHREQDDRGSARNLLGIARGMWTCERDVTRRAVKRVEFQLDGPVDVMVDGEIVTLDCKELEILPGVMDVYV